MIIIPLTFVVKRGEILIYIPTSFLCVLIGLNVKFLLTLQNNKGNVSKVFSTTKMNHADTSDFFAVPLGGIISRPFESDDMCHYDQIPKSNGMMSS